jgi:hypothetical protein
MIRRASTLTEFCSVRGARRVAAWMIVACLVPVVALAPALAQQQGAPQDPAQKMELAPAPGSSAPEPAPAQKDSRGGGLIEALGDFFDKASEALSLKGATDSITDFNRKAGEATRDAAKAATDNLGRLPVTRIASGRSLCVVAANGAPDCGAAAAVLCKSKGMNGGTSVATESSERCPAQVLLSGRAPRPGECRMETFVTSAMCQ